MAKYLTYDEFIALAKKNYKKGGDGYYECTSKKDWEREPEIFSKLTKTKALQMFAVAYDIDQDMKGYADYEDVVTKKSTTPQLHSGYRCDKCHKAFIHPRIVTENNGFNGWDGPTHYESFPVSPCCKYEFEKVTDITDEELSVAESNEEYYAEQRELEDMMAWNFR